MSRDASDKRVFSTPVRRLSAEELERVAGGEYYADEFGCTGSKSCGGMDFAAKNHH